MADSRKRLLKKQNFYQDLAALVQSDDDDLAVGQPAPQDVVEEAPAEQAAISGFVAQDMAASRSSRADPRSHADNCVVSDTSRILENSDDIYSEHQMAPQVRSMAARQDTSRKRRRVSNRAAPSAAKGVFDGLRFYFLPNNDVASARRMRITKALEFGASWEREWSAKVTHVILDKNVTCTDFLAFTKLQAIPGHVVVVNENYPAECILYRTLLNPQLPQFAAKGYPLTLATAQHQPDAAKSPKRKQVDKIATVSLSQPKISIPHPSEIGEALDAQTSSEARAPLDLHRIDVDEESAEHNSDFRDALEQARTFETLPFDQEDAEQMEDHLERYDSNKDQSDSGAPIALRGEKSYRTVQDRFQCMHKHTADKSNNPNQSIVDILQQMAAYYGQIGDEWRLRAYRGAITTLKKHPSKVTSKEDALQLPNIGERLALKIEEIAFTSRLQRLEYAQAEPRDQVLQQFTQIHGVGFQQASRWVAEGHRTLDDLLQRARLTANQRIGIEHFADFAARIPRAEVAQHGAVVRRALQALDPSFEVIVAGSFRRGAPTSGDIDCIVTRRGADAEQLRRQVLGLAVPRLVAAGFLVATLAASSSSGGGGGGGGGSKWLGASQLPAGGSDDAQPSPRPWRRLDLLLVPDAERGAALIYFTGNDTFNRSLRLLARRKGMRLNEHGLYRDVLRGKGGAKLSAGALLEARSERRIFQILGVPWRPPEHRVC